METIKQFNFDCFQGSLKCSARKIDQSSNMQIKRPKKSDKKPSTLRRFHYFTKLRNAHLILNPLRVSRYLGITTVLCKSKSLFGTLFCIDSMQNVQKSTNSSKERERKSLNCGTILLWCHLVYVSRFDDLIITGVVICLFSGLKFQLELKKCIIFQ